MSIWIDAHYAPDVERLLVPAPVQIQAPRICVDLDCNAVQVGAIRPALI